MLFTVCFFVRVSHCMSSVSLSVGVVIVEASKLSAESDMDLRETGEMNSFSTAYTSCFTVFPAVQQKHNYLASFSSRLRRFSLSSKVFFSLSASPCLSTSSLWRRRWVSSRLSQKACTPHSRQRVFELHNFLHTQPLRQYLWEQRVLTLLSSRLSNGLGASTKHRKHLAASLRNQRVLCTGQN